jgi:hypothetical protein
MRRRIHVLDTASNSKIAQITEVDRFWADAVSPDGKVLSLPT